MATISVLCKKRNQGKEQPIWVMFRHGREEVAVSVGVIIDPKLLRSNGTVIGPDATHFNGLINAIKSDLQLAYDRLVDKAVIPITRDMVKREYELVKATRLTEEAKGRFLGKAKDYEQTKQAEKVVLSVEDLRIQLEEDEQRLAEKRLRLSKLTAEATTLFSPTLIKLFDGNEAQAKSFQKELAADKEHLFVSFIQRFLNEQKNNQQRSTQLTYNSVVSALNDYNPNLKIQEVNRAVLYEFEDHLIKRGNLNSTIEKITSQAKGVLNYYAHDLNLSQSYKGYKFKLPKMENDILHLSLGQLEEFWAYEKPAKVSTRYKNPPQPAFPRMKDMFVFMCGTSLRYSDLKTNFADHIKTIKGQEQIVLYPHKTRSKQIKVSIPLSPLLKAILERHDYHFQWIKESYFRDLLEEFCADLPSFQEPVTWWEYVGQTKRLVLDPVTQQKPKFFQRLGTHTGRRTWINFAFQSRWSIPEIMGVSGHTDMKTLSLYASKAKMEDGIRPLSFFDRTQ